MNINDTQIGGAHYKSGYQPWDFTLDVFEGNFFLGNANKYIVRWRKKNGREDLEKAKHYLLKYQDCVGSGRLAPLRSLSNEAATALLKHFACCNNLQFTETDILAAMMLGRVEVAIRLIDRLIKEEFE